MGFLPLYSGVGGRRKSDGRKAKMLKGDPANNGQQGTLQLVLSVWFFSQPVSSPNMDMKSPAN